MGNAKISFFFSLPFFPTLYFSPFLLSVFFFFPFVEHSRDKLITSVQPPHTVSTLPRPRPVAVSRITRTVNLPTKLAFESRSRGVQGNFVIALLQNRAQITQTAAKREKKKRRKKEGKTSGFCLYIFLSRYLRCECYPYHFSYFEIPQLVVLYGHSLNSHNYSYINKSHCDNIGTH